MPRRNSRVQNRKRLPRKKKTTRQRRRKNTTHTIGNLIAHGVTNLLGYVPGAAYLKDLASFVFQQFGWNGLRTYYDPEFYGDINWLGMSCRFAINYVVLAVNCHLGITTSHQDNNKRQFLTQFEDCRLLNLRISIMPMCEQGSRQGLIAAVFVPFQSDSDEEHVARATPTFVDIMCTLGAKQGTASRPLTIDYTPSSPWARDYHRADTSFGVFQAAYYDPQRLSPKTNFAVNEFNAEIRISGSIQFRKPLLEGGYTTFSPNLKPLVGGERVDLNDKIYHLNDDHTVNFEVTNAKLKSMMDPRSSKKWGNPTLDVLNLMIHESE